MKWFNFLTLFRTQARTEPPYFLHEENGHWYIVDRQTGKAIARLNNIDGGDPKANGELIIQAVNSWEKLIDAVRLAYRLAKIDQKSARRYIGTSRAVNSAYEALKIYRRALRLAGVKP